MTVRKDVSHFICEALDVRDFVIVSVVLVVKAGEAAKIGSHLI